jgi:hypothetical protein
MSKQIWIELVFMLTKNCVKQRNYLGILKWEPDAETFGHNDAVALLQAGG